MITNTITCHDVYNHGASLQAYALQLYLESLGHNNEIINYKPPYLSGHYDLWKVCNPAWDNNYIARLIYLSLKLPGRILYLKRKSAFDRFTKACLRLTQKRYACNDELKNDCPEADVFIAGSDQIWNTLFENGKDPAFYLDFAPESKIKISYAASFATEKIFNGYEDFVKRMVARLDFISVREQSGVELLHNMRIYNAIHVCDPVFLLDEKEWADLTPIVYNCKYLLVYATEKSDLLKRISISIAKKMRLKIYSIGAFHLNYANRNFQMAGPAEFVSLIKSAEYVISNSFHATAFALIFQKNLCVVNRSEAINTRMKNLLESLGIYNRLVGDGFDVDELTERIDYQKVNKLLSTTISNSKRFLQKSILSLA